jgi:DNA-binding FadR family transcriptional regulator
MSLPSERELSETLAVNRHVVREAVKRLEQIGLVRVVQGGRTTVLDFRRSAGLDLLAILAEQGEAGDAFVPLFAAAMEMRAGIGADVARLCAQRAGDAIGDELLEICELLAAAAKGPELVALDERFWRLVVDGAGNLAYQLAFNSLIRAVHGHLDMSVAWLEQELARGEYRRPIAVAIGRGDGGAAADATRRALAPTPPEQPGRRPDGAAR